MISECLYQNVILINQFYNLNQCRPYMDCNIQNLHWTASSTGSRSSNLAIFSYTLPRLCDRCSNKIQYLCRQTQFCRVINHSIIGYKTLRHSLFDLLLKICIIYFNKQYIYIIDDWGFHRAFCFRNTQTMNLFFC